MVSVLIVEDEPLVRQGLARLVDYDALGVTQVREACDGQDAWEMLNAEVPDILVTDINMPRMDGVTLAKKVKLTYPQVHLIFLTGYDYVDYLLAAVKLGADDYLLKPVTKVEFEGMLAKVVDKFRQEEKRVQLEALQQGPGDLPLERMIFERLGDSTLSLTSLAEELGFSPNYLSSLIKKQIGMSFQDYVMMSRMQQAKVLLLSTSMKVYEVAEAVGMTDVNYFSVRFKQVVGVTPKQYQKGVHV